MPDSVAKSATQKPRVFVTEMWDPAVPLTEPDCNVINMVAICDPYCMVKTRPDMITCYIERSGGKRKTFSTRRTPL